MGTTQTILDAKEIERILKRMANELLAVHKELSSMALIGIHTRGVYLAHRLRDHIQAFENIAVAVGEMDITLYRDDWTQMNPQPVVKTTDIPFAVEGRQIILVDDVLFTGRTIRAAMDAIIDFGRPARMELAILIDRGHRELPIQSNYTGHRLETQHADMINVLLQECDGEDKVVLETA